MNRRWKKLGRLYVPPEQGRHPKLLTHAANPLPVHLAGDVYRVFFSGRDSINRSSVGAVDIDIVRRTVVEDHYHPFFEHGAEGSFYADGVSIGNCYMAGGARFMLFMGWQNPRDGHWRGDIGRLVMGADLTLSLDDDVPFMGSDENDPLSLSYPWVRENDDGSFSMWYGSTRTWEAGNSEMLHVINAATSMDGHHWHRKGLAIPFALGKAQAFSRPTVIRNEQGEDEMWFSYRSGSGEKYRIGHARSANQITWTLDLDGAGIDISSDGWDSDMIEYPFVFDHDGQRYMLYNGNSYGKTGFGLAILEPV